jgi:uncharacterized protein YecE (DUF72 family)
MKESTYRKWRDSTPDGFLWAIKASRFITHIRRLHDVEEPLRRFFNSVSVLGNKLGPILFQLPPSLAFDRTLLEDFSAQLISAGISQNLRCAIEPRHKSWMDDKALSALKEHGFGFCISDTGGRYPYREAVTADFTYIRLHGPTTLYSSCYSEEELKIWAEKIISMDCDVYSYFDNDYMGYAPANALTLKKFLEK